MTTADCEVRCANPGEFPAIGQLMVAVYSRLDGFPDPTEQPEYYRMLASVGGLTKRPQTELLVAVSPEGDLFGAVVYQSLGFFQTHPTGLIVSRILNDVLRLQRLSTTVLANTPSVRVGGLHWPQQYAQSRWR